MNKTDNSGDAQKHTLLIVDDNPANLSVIVDYLAGHGFRIMVARDGETALRLAQQDHPDLILLDVLLPGMDGFEVCRRLKADERTRDIPVIFMTIVTKTEDKVRGFEAGGVDYITKPFQHEEVLERVATHLQIRDLNRELEAAKENLERRVEQRTTELAQANVKLKKEIGEREQAEEALRKSESLLNATQRLTKVGGWEYEVKSGKSFWTEELYRIHEIPNDHGIDHLQASLQCYGPEDRQIIDAAFRHACEKGEAYDLELPFTTRQGKLLWVRTTAQPVYEEGRVARVVGNLMDITERKQAEEALKVSEERFRRLAENARDVIYRMSLPDGIYEYMSPAATELSGYTPEEFYGSPQLVRKVIHPDWLGYFDEQWSKLLHGDLPTTYEYPIIHKSGDLRWVNQRNILVRDSGGHIIAIEGIITDVTERKRAEEEIRRLNQELEQRVINRTAQLEAANKELEAFAYSISHDLRAPLRHIDGFIDILRHRAASNLDDQSRHYMDVIADSARTMGALIDDLLSFSRMGRNEISKAEVDLNELVQDVLREIKPEIEDRAIQWEIAALPVVSGDRAMLRIVATNLISNALKFTRSRTPAKIEMGCLPDQKDETTMFVRDNGVGFDMNYVDKLFGVFQRLHGTDEFEGTGIGLANVRRIINRHGGRTWAEGEVDHGATFYFSLPKP